MQGERRSVYGILVGKPQGKRSLVRPRSRLDYNTIMYIREGGLGGMNGLIWFRIGASGELLLAGQ
jgi:hypothetical protein